MIRPCWWLGTWHPHDATCAPHRRMAFEEILDHRPGRMRFGRMCPVECRTWSENCGDSFTCAVGGQGRQPTSDHLRFRHGDSPPRTGPERRLRRRLHRADPTLVRLGLQPCGWSVTLVPFVMGATLGVAGPCLVAACLSPACVRSHACPSFLFTTRLPADAEAGNRSSRPPAHTRASLAPAGTMPAVA